jgi:hypothetical protein
MTAKDAFEGYVYDDAHWSAMCEIIDDISEDESLTATGVCLALRGYLWGENFICGDDIVTESIDFEMLAVMLVGRWCICKKEDEGNAQKNSRPISR